MDNTVSINAITTYNKSTDNNNASTSNNQNKTYKKTTLTSEQQQYISSQPWGHDLNVKSTDSIRIGCHNIHFLQQFCSGIKNEGLMNDIHHAKLDIIGCSKISLAW
jgi:hypothetical protein